MMTGSEPANQPGPPVVLTNVIGAIGALCAMVIAAEEATTARLLTAGPTLAPGTPLSVGIEIKPPAGWHTYWKNPGDSGLPTTVEWTLPPGWRATALEWPAPVAFEADGIVGFGYEGPVVLLAGIVPPPNAKPGRYDLRANVTWLACKDGCFPGKAALATTVSIGGANLRTPDAKTLDAWRSRVPTQSLKGAKALATGEGWILSWPADRAPALPRFFPDEPAIVDHADQVGKASGDRAMLFLKRSAYLQGAPERLRGVLVLGSEPNAPAFLVDAPIESAQHKVNL